MCGRYTLIEARLIAAALGVIAGIDINKLIDKPRYNIAPSQQVPIVRFDSNGQREIVLAKWGLIPSWTKDKPKLQPINARAETISTSPMFRQAFERRRCLVPADGFYEWQGVKPPKQPYFIHRPDSGMFAFAGLWERWQPPSDDEPIDTVTIITTSPNSLMRPIHNRMPVILEPGDYGKWLDPATPAEELLALLMPCADENLSTHPISSQVNKPANDGPALIAPLVG